MNERLRVYLSGTGHDPRFQSQELPLFLEQNGHEVVSTWHRPGVWVPASAGPFRIEEAMDSAVRNYGDLLSAHVVVAVAPPVAHHLRGLHAECGFVHGLNAARTVDPGSPFTGNPASRFTVPLILLGPRDAFNTMVHGAPWQAVSTAEALLPLLEHWRVRRTGTRIDQRAYELLDMYEQWSRQGGRGNWRVPEHERTVHRRFADLAFAAHYLVEYMDDEGCIALYVQGRRQGALTSSSAT